MKPKIATVFIVLICCLFSGCREEALSGEVKSKEFLPAYTTIIPTTTIIYNGKTAIPVIIPIVYSYPDRWKLTIKREENGKLQDIYVTQECFEKVNINDYFVYDSDYCSLDEPVMKRRQK